MFRILLPVFILTIPFFACKPSKSLTYSSFLQEAQIPFDRDSNQSVTYEQAIDAYQKMANAFPKKCRLTIVGKTDCGKPLHVFILSSSGTLTPGACAAAGLSSILINNGIHPGEPEGIDASILFARNILTDKQISDAYRNLVFLIIPIYNVDGALNRSSTSRANQNGPESYGFRGNARNLDLNRDFIKADSENAKSFQSIFQTWKPDIFIDNHTSNGADYQYTMTLLPTHHAKLAPAQAELLQKNLLPTVFADMEKKGWPMSPYVNEIQSLPDSGILGFMDYGRYSSGYASMFNCIGFTPETHMLKPFGQRLKSTYALMHTLSLYTAQHIGEIKKAKQQAQTYWANATSFPLDWEADMTQADSLLFRGYEGSVISSCFHQGTRLFYDRSKPFKRNIPFFDHFDAKNVVQAPKAYLIPQAWQEVISRLRQNGVQMQLIANDTAVWVTSYRIKDFKTRNAYEGHYYHYSVEVDTIHSLQHFASGDMLIRTNQSCNRYIVETLEPSAPDSWFAWNFFDGILMQKEYFSEYVFEDLAEAYLKENPTLSAELDAKMAAEPDFAKDGSAVLRWVYYRSPFYEPTHKLYPIARLEAD